ncbi:MAG: PspC domain-containing protein [Anaerolineales bacterium]|nr:PspC domain-containing protein [Anaerolineales bacterium]MCB8952036.1 PspC domain-containing protein [Ardenticatenales bacterium]
MTENRLVRSETDKIIAGVCGGIAAYMKIDPLLVRIAFLLLIPASGLGPLLYLALTVIMPRETHLDTPPRAYARQNLSTLGQTVSESVERLSQSEGRPLLIGGLLMLLGAFLLLNNFGWFDAGILSALFLVLIGVYILLRR